MWRAEQFIAGKTVVRARISCSCTTMWNTSQQARWDPCSQHTCGILGVCLTLDFIAIYIGEVWHTCCCLSHDKLKGGHHAACPLEPLPRTKWGCPLFVRGQDLVAVPATNLICDVLFMHHCGSGCKVVQQGRTRQIERENVEISTIKFFYNVFCLNNLAISASYHW